MNSDRNIIIEFLNSLDPMESCQFEELNAITNCISPELSKGDTFFSDIATEYKEAAKYYLLEVQKTSPELGAMCEILYRLETDDYSDIKADIDVERLKSEAKSGDLLPIISKEDLVNKKNSVSAVSNSEDPVQFGGNGNSGLIHRGQQTRQERINALRQQLERVRSSIGTTATTTTTATRPQNNRNRRIAGLSDIQKTELINREMVVSTQLLRTAPPNFKTDIIEKNLIKCRIPEKIAKTLSVLLCQSWPAIKNLIAITFSGILAGRTLTIPRIMSYTFPSDEQLLTDLESRTFDAFETNSFEKTTAIHTTCILALKERAKAENRSLNDNEKNVITELERLNQLRTQIHNEIVKERTIHPGKKFITRVFLRTIIILTRKYLLLVLFTLGGLGSYLLDIFEVFISLMFSGINKGIIKLLGGIPVAGSLLASTYKNLTFYGSMGIDAVVTYGSLGTQYRYIRDSIVRNGWRIIFLAPEVTNYINFYYSIALSLWSGYYWNQNDLQRARWEAERLRRFEASAINQEAQYLVERVNPNIRTEARAAASTPIYDPSRLFVTATGDIFFGGKHKTRIYRKRRNNLRKRKRITRKH